MNGAETIRSFNPTSKNDELKEAKMLHKSDGMQIWMMLVFG